MIDIFDSSKTYIDSDPEILRLIGSKTKQAQMRYQGRSPNYFKLGKKVVYHGKDLNAWAQANRKEISMGM